MTKSLFLLSISIGFILVIGNTFLPKFLPHIAFLLGCVILARAISHSTKHQINLLRPLIPIIVTYIISFILFGIITCGFLPEIKSCSENNKNAALFANLCFPMIPIVGYSLFVEVPRLVKKWWRNHH
jgi:hypothetical protein